MAEENRRDPFRLAKQKQDLREGIIEQGPFDNPKLLKEEKPKQDTSNLNFTLGKPDAQQMDMQRIPQLITKLGIGLGQDGQAIDFSMDEIGRARLITALRNKFGTQFMDNPEAEEIMRLFSQQIQSNPEEAQRRLTRGAAGADSILEALKGIGSGNSQI